MEKVTKAQVMNNLANEWPGFMKDFESLSEESKRIYLQKQGFSTPVALISHIVAWWEDAYKNVNSMRNDPEYKSPNQDVDKFNADIVKKTANDSIADAAVQFEESRKRLLQLVTALDKKDYENSEIQKEIFWDITNHYKDHRIE